VTINPAYRANELAYLLNQADITCLFLTIAQVVQFSEYSREVCPTLAAGQSFLPRLSCPSPKTTMVNQHPKRRTARHAELDVAVFGRLATKASPPKLQRRQRGRSDYVVISSTLGTTGFSKGARLVSQPASESAPLRPAAVWAAPRTTGSASPSVLKTTVGCVPGLCYGRPFTRGEVISPSESFSIPWRPSRRFKASAHGYLRRADHVHRPATHARFAELMLQQPSAPASLPAALPH